MNQIHVRSESRKKNKDFKPGSCIKGKKKKGAGEGRKWREDQASFRRKRTVSWKNLKISSDPVNRHLPSAKSLRLLIPQASPPGC